MCNCNRRHKQVTSAAMAAMRAQMTQEERAMASANAAIEYSGGFVPASEPVTESVVETVSTPEPTPVSTETTTATKTTSTVKKTATKKS